MKKSTKIFSVAVIVLLLSLVIHDLGLRAAYLQGDYKAPDHGFVHHDFKAFDRIELDAATSVNLKIEQGPFEVRSNPQASDFLKIKQENGTLYISAEFPEHYQGLNAPYAVYVHCPQLKMLKMSARYTVDGRTVIDTAAHDPDWKPSLVSGFKADSLRLEQDYAANLRLENNQFHQLRVVAGLSRHAGSALSIGEGNHIEKADFDIRNYSLLRLQAQTGGTTNYQLANTSHLNLDGIAAKPFIKTSQP